VLPAVGAIWVHMSLCVRTSNSVMCDQAAAIPQFRFSSKSLLLLLPLTSVLLNYYRLRPKP
jgi:hypothetical protein